MATDLRTTTVGGSGAVSHGILGLLAGYLHGILDSLPATFHLLPYIEDAVLDLLTGYYGAPTLVISDAVQIEPSTANDPTIYAAFTVSLSAPSTKPVTVNYATADGSALAGSDYTATSGTLTFAPGEIVKQVKVPILGDNSVEGTENFSVTLSDPTNAGIAVGVGLGTILDQDTGATAPPPLNIVNGGPSSDILVGVDTDNTISGYNGRHILFGLAGHDAPPWASPPVELQKLGRTADATGHLGESGVSPETMRSSILFNQFAASSVRGQEGALLSYAVPPPMVSNEELFLARPHA